jgi:hypothetical protein
MDYSYTPYLTPQGKVVPLAQDKIIKSAQVSTKNRYRRWNDRPNNEKEKERERSEKLELMEKLYEKFGNSDKTRYYSPW